MSPPSAAVSAGPVTPSIQAGPASPPRRILYIDHTAMMGGGEIALLNLLKQIDRTRYTPVVCLFADGPLADALREQQIELHIIPLSKSVATAKKDALGWRSFFRIREVASSALFLVTLARFIRKADVQLVHTNSLKADIIAGVASRVARVPLVWHVRDRITRDYLPGPVVSLFKLLAQTVPDYVVVNSEATLTTLAIPQKIQTAALYSGLNFGRDSRVIHDGTPDTDREPAPPAVHDGWRLGLVGRISPWKGQHIFLQAAAIVRKRFPDARFQIIGGALFAEHDYEQQVRSLCTSLGLDGVVEFTGFRKDVPHLIANLDILVHASTTGEPFGQVVIEGMAAGKPVIATDGGGVPEIVIDGATGLLVPMNDAPAMADAMIRLLADPAMAARIAELGRVRAVEYFSIRRTAAHVEALYEELLENPKSSLQTMGRRLPSAGRAKSFVSFALALLFPVVALIATLGTDRVLGDAGPRLGLFYAAVVLTACTRGFLPALFSAVVSILLVDLVLVRSRGVPLNGTTLAMSLLFIAVSGLLSWMVAALKRNVGRARHESAQSLAARQRAAFLARINTTVATLASPEELLNAVAQTAKRDFSEWFILDLFSEGGQVRRIDAVHRDPHLQPLMVQLKQMDPISSDDSHACTQTLRIHPDVALPLKGSTLGTLPAAIAGKLGCNSYLAVPLLAHGICIGSMTFVRSSHQPPFTVDEFELATELGLRLASRLRELNSTHDCIGSTQ